MNSLSSIHSHGFLKTSGIPGFVFTPLVELEFENGVQNIGSASVIITQTVATSQSYTTGRIDTKALTFTQANNTISTGNNGSRSYISVAVGNLAPPYTVCMWVYNNVASTGNNSLIEIVTPLCTAGVSIFSQYSSTSFFMVTQGHVASFTGSPYFTTGSWVHLTLVFTNTTDITTYYNGALAATTAAFTTLQNTTPGTYTFNVGWAPRQATAYGNPAFSGALDQFLIYNTALTAAQISGVYNGTIRF